MTRYVVVGAGAVGGALGGLLAQQDREVLLVARGEHARVMGQRGLTLRCPDTTMTLPVPVVTDPDQAHLTLDDVVVLATKTQHAEAAVSVWADVPVHGHDGAVVGRVADMLPVLTALNGVTGEEIALRYIERVFAVCVWFPTVLLEPGEVIVRGAPLRGVFHVGRYGLATDSSDLALDDHLLDTLARDGEAAGCVIRRPEAVMAWKYRKLLSNLGNSLQALCGSLEGGEDIHEAAQAEASSVLAAAGIAVTPDEEARADWEPEGLSFAMPVPGAPATLGGSTWQSLQRGTSTVETDFLNGEIALIARRIGRKAPVNAGLAALARRAARAGARPGSMTTRDVRGQLGL